MTQLELEIVTEKPWMSEWVRPMVMAVYPLGERDDHELGDEDCDCRPSVENPRGEIQMIVHNADGE